MGNTGSRKQAKDSRRTSRRATIFVEPVISDKMLTQLFKEFDKNSDGFVTKDEFEEGLRRLQITPTPQEIDCMMSLADANCDKQINITEFRELVHGCSALSFLIEAYQQFDANGDGIVSIQDVKRVMKELGQKMSIADMQALFIAADKDKDGSICFEEFAHLMRARPLTLNIKSIFETYDINSDGFITISELREVCDKLQVPATDEELKVMLSVCDTSGDGRISYDEFQHLLKQGQQPKVN